MNLNALLNLNTKVRIVPTYVVFSIENMKFYRLITPVTDWISHHEFVEDL